MSRVSNSVADTANIGRPNNNMRPRRVKIIEFVFDKLLATQVVVSYVEPAIAAEIVTALMTKHPFAALKISISPNDAENFDCSGRELPNVIVILEQTF